MDDKFCPRCGAPLVLKNAEVIYNKETGLPSATGDLVCSGRHWWNFLAHYPYVDAVDF